MLFLDEGSEILKVLEFELGLTVRILDQHNDVGLYKDQPLLVKGDFWNVVSIDRVNCVKGRVLPL